MTSSFWFNHHHFLTPSQSADVVILGAGLVGLSTAYWLSEFKPELKIIVLDRARVGAGASGRNAGFVTKGSASFYKSLVDRWGDHRAQLLFHFAQDSLELLHHHILKKSKKIDFEKSISLTLFKDENSQVNFLQSPFRPEDFGFFWKRSEELTPQLSENFYAALENGPEYSINPSHLLNEIREILEKRDVQIWENQSAFEITEAGVATELNLIPCKQVVLALNGYSSQFNSAFKDIIFPYRAQMLAVELDAELDSKALHYDPLERVYWRKFKDNILLIGGKRLLDEAGEVGEYDKLSPSIQKALESYLNRLIGPSFRVKQRWSGIMGFTSDELPILTKAKAALDCYIIGGFSGHGMGLGFRASQEIAKMIYESKNESFFDQFKKLEIVL
jgi:gamma-glutamylputrescine oxidase